MLPHAAPDVEPALGQTGEGMRVCVCVRARACSCGEVADGACDNNCNSWHALRILSLDDDNYLREAKSNGWPDPAVARCPCHS